MAPTSEAAVDELDGRFGPVPGQGRESTVERQTAHLSPGRLAGLEPAASGERALGRKWDRGSPGGCGGKHRWALQLVLASRGLTPLVGASWRAGWHLGLH